MFNDGVCQFSHQSGSTPTIYNVDIVLNEVDRQLFSGFEISLIDLRARGTIDTDSHGIIFRKILKGA
jgi:hypothetical protein